MEYPLVKMRSIVLSSLVAALGVSTTAQAAEVRFDGFYRTRMRVANTLTLKRDIDENVGTTWDMRHRFWLRPKFYITNELGVFAEFKGLDNVRWGTTPFLYTDPLTQQKINAIYGNDLTSPNFTGDGSAASLDFTLWRAWAEVHTAIGTFKFGRMPLHWGMGIWQNDGLGYNAEYGDTTDRLMWENIFADVVFVRLAFDTEAPGLVSGEPISYALNLAAGYKSERIKAGLNAQYRRQNGADGFFNLYTVDGAADLELGPIELNLEVVGQFGSGSLSSSLSDVSLSSLGAALDAGYNASKFNVHLEAGIATGDKDPNDSKFHTFTFDRDYNTGFLLFEQAMPVLASAAPTDENQGLELNTTLSGNAISNAFFLRPRGEYEIIKDFSVVGAAMFAWTAAVPPVQAAANRRFYGSEVDLGLKYTIGEHFFVEGLFGLLVPGTVYSNYTDEFYSDFSAITYGGQVIMRVDF